MPKQEEKVISIGVKVLYGILGIVFALALFYIGLGIANLPKSNLYIDLEENQYKKWLWQDIKTKGLAYQELLVMKDMIVKGQELILVCSCDKQGLCHNYTVKKALFYLLKQEGLSRVKEWFSDVR
jgi:hypothetical protein